MRCNGGKLASDAILFGVPHLCNENLTSIFNHLCLTVECQPPTLRSIFRSHQRDGCNDPPIILKFFNTTDKYSVIKSLAEYRIKEKRQLCLRNFGLDSDKNVYLNESLTKKNRSLIKRAVQLKHKKIIFSAFTKNGLVMIKETKEGRNTVIDNEEALNMIVARRQAAEKASIDGLDRCNINHNEIL